MAFTEGSRPALAFTEGGYPVSHGSGPHSHGSHSPDVAGIISCSVVHNSPGYRWIVDTRATNHMVSTHKLLYETQSSSPNESNKVHLPNGQQIPIALIGKSKLEQETYLMFYTFLILITTCYQFLN